MAGNIEASARCSKCAVELVIGIFHPILDKGGEKLAESEEDLLEHRTDGTDAFDTLYIGCEKFPYRDNFSFTASGII